MENLKFTTHQKAVTREIGNNTFLFIPLCIFSLLFLPYTTVLPYLDGNIDFVQTVLYHTGEFSLYFKFFSSVHPPLKIFLFDFFYSIFGVYESIPTLLGYLWGVVGITCFYYLLKKLSPGSEKIGSLLLSISPLYISVGIFYLTDYILTNLILFMLLMYIREKKILLLAGLICTVLVKETGLLIPGIFLIIELSTSINKKRFLSVKNVIFYSIPFSIYYVWFLFMSTKGISTWNDWIFTDTADQGTFYTIVNNVVTLKIFNEYATQHFLQLLFLNFNWIIIAISIFITIIILIRKENRKKIIQAVILFDAQSKTILFILIFCILYALTVLTFQTYTIPRYALPIIPFLLLWFSVVVTQLKNFFVKATSIFVVFLLTILGLFFSVDPIANTIWGKVNVLGQNVYATNYHLSGNDGITYNYQYLLIAKKRTEIIRQDITFPQEYCRFLFPDPQNDSITAYLLEFSHSKAVKKCGLVSSGQEY